MVAFVAMYLSVSPYQDVLDGLATALSPATSANQSLVTLAGPAGVGKTALCEQLIGQLHSRGMRVVHFSKPPVTIDALQTGILQQLSLAITGNFTRTFTDYLLGQSADTNLLILLVDDAQDLPVNVLNAMRLLCNVRDKGKVLMKLFLCGRSHLGSGSLLAANAALGLDNAMQMTLAPLSLDQLRNFYWQHQRLQRRESGMPSALQLQALMAESGGLPGAVIQSIDKYRPVQSVRVADSPPVEKAHRKLQSSSWLSGRWLAIEVTVVVILVAGAYLVHQQPAQSDTTVAVGSAPVAEAQPAPAAANDSTVTMATTASTSQTTLAAEIPAVDPAPTPAVLEANDAAALLTEWTGAWQQHNLDGYFAAYSADFAPPSGLTTDSWRAQRQRSIGNASDISIRWRELTMESQDSDNAVFTVWLDYDSATYRDSTLKQLQVHRNGNQWQITAENNVRVEKR